MIKLGEKVKRFKLKDQHGVAFDSTGVKGKRLLLSFHPLAWTSICAKQMQSLAFSKTPDVLEWAGNVLIEEGVRPTDSLKIADRQPLFRNAILGGKLQGEIPIPLFVALG